VKVLELTEALKYGLIGLGAILAILSFFLITKEQNKPEPRKQILNSVYMFMGFSVVLLLMGLVGETQKNANHNGRTMKVASGFEVGALNGEWHVNASDTPVGNNPDFKVPEYHYSGNFNIIQNEDEVIFDGYLDRQRIGSDSVIVRRIKFKGNGPINNNYVGAQYYFQDDRQNGFGTMLVMFNNDAASADAYMLFRPTTTLDRHFGLLYAKLLRAE
jgi:hypothetical protein